MGEATILIVFGFFFGLLLQKARLTRYSTIVNVFRFRDMTVIKFMMSALATAMIGVYFLRDIGVVSTASLMPSYLLGNFVGGLIFGIGMAWAGF